MTTKGGWGLPEDVVFDGQRLRQVGPDGEHVTFRDPAAEQAAWATFARRLQAQRLRAEAAATARRHAAEMEALQAEQRARGAAHERELATLQGRAAAQEAEALKALTITIKGPS